MFVIVDGKKVEVGEGASGSKLAEQLNLRAPHEALAMKLKGKIVDLTTTLHDGDEIHFLSFQEKEGKEVYWHTSAHVLAQAILRLFPEAKPTIGPPIEQGFYYDFADLHITEEDFDKIEREVMTILDENYESQRRQFSGKKEALSLFQSNPYKRELIEGMQEGEPITAYTQGEFTDLCRGPHLCKLGKIKSFKILKTSGAYWRGDSEREMLTRVYAISFPDRMELKAYLDMLEEAKKRDHKILGPRLGLFLLREEAPGMPFLLPKGLHMWNRLVELRRQANTRAGYIEIKTPQLMNQALWERSGHWSYYRENMFTLEMEKREYALKPMNCPGCMLFYSSCLHSYRELPLRVAEIGHVHRFEHSGALSGLVRVRSFHQDDSHLFLKPDDIKTEMAAVIDLCKELYSVFGLSWRFELSTRPEKSMGSDVIWEKATHALREALEEAEVPFHINEGDGAFYGPKIDLHIRDALGRSWQCGTIQADMLLPEKFDLKYTDSDGAEKQPVMFHVAIYGSLERFLGILIEHFAGKFPLWISPSQVRIVTVADRHIPYANELKKECQSAGILCEVDDSSESVSKKIREAQLMNFNYILTVGDREQENRTASIRTGRDNVVHGEWEMAPFIALLHQEINSKALESALGKK